MGSLMLATLSTGMILGDSIDSIPVLVRKPLLRIVMLILANWLIRFRMRLLMDLREICFAVLMKFCE